MTAFAWRMTVRSLTRRPGRTAVTCAAVATAVAALVVLAAIMVGVGDTMIRNAAALHSGHVQASPADSRAADAVARLGGVRSVLSRRQVQSTWNAGSIQVATGAWAVEPDAARAELAAAKRLTAGTFLAEPGEAVIGAVMAETLKVKLHDELMLFQPGSSPRRVRVGGIFRTGVPWLDDRTVYARLADMAVEPDEAAVFLDDPESADVVAAKIRALLPAGAQVQTWRQTAPEMSQLIVLERVSMNVVLLLAMLILALGVSNTAILTVAQRTREIGILKAMGVGPARLAAQVLGEMLLLTGLGALAGMALGAAAAAAWGAAGLDLAAWTSENRHFLLSSVVYPRATWYWALAPGAVAAACGALAGLLPAWRAARVNVVQALRWI